MKVGKIFRTKHLFSAVLLITSLIAILISITLFYLTLKPQQTAALKEYPEISYLENKTLDFTQLKSYFKQLSEEKGAVYAFEVLNTAPMPYGTDMHLLAHTVGDELYKQKGIKGMKYCTDNFRNACSHSMVINLFYDKGEAGIKDVTEACRNAPGKGGYSMCYHGLGHGVFAFAGYEFPKTAELCKKVSHENINGPEYKECMGGAVMEQISGGDHDKISWQKQREVNIKPGQPLSMCMTDLITDPGPREICLIYLTPHLWDLAGRTSADLSDDVITRAFEFCDEIPRDDPQNRSACFGGFGKEFLAMAKGKDVRHIDKLTDIEMQKIYYWCLLTPHKDGQKSCILYAQGSMYWSGANDKKLPIHFCSLAPDEEIKKYCFEGLIGTIKKGDLKEKNYFEEFCSEIPETMQENCRTQLLK